MIKLNIKADTADFLNEIIEKEYLCMLRFQDGRIYLLWNHYKHLDPEDAQPVFLCNGVPPKKLRTRPSNRIKGAVVAYITEPVKW